MMDKWKSMTSEDKKLFVGCMLLGVLVLGGGSWFGFVYRPSHMAKTDVGTDKGILLSKYTYVEYGNTYGIMTLGVKSLSDSDSVSWCMPLDNPCLSLTVQLDFAYMNTSSISAFAQAKVNDTIVITRTYLCNGYTPHSLTSYWISGCDLQTTTVEESK